MNPSSRKRRALIRALPAAIVAQVPATQALGASGPAASDPPASGSSAAAAPAWPVRPVRFVVPYAAGGTTDIVARLVADRLAQRTGGSFVVENRVGATGTIATQQMARATPDGHALLVDDTTYAMLPALFAKLPWDHANAFAPVTTMATTPVVLVVAADSPLRSLRQLLDAARAEPGRFSFGSGGSGSSTHLAAAVLMQQAGLDLVHVPYKGAGDAMLGVMGRQVDVLITAAPTALAQVQSARVRALAVSGAQPLAALPDVPSFAQAGLPDYRVMNWFGLAAPAGTPAALITAMHAHVVAVLAEPAVRERFDAIGAVPGGLAPERFAALIADETRSWTEVARTAGVKPN